MKAAAIGLTALTGLGLSGAAPPDPPEVSLEEQQRATPEPQDDAYLSMSAERAMAFGKAMREDGRVGGWFDTRILSTDRSYSYKLRATWLTPDVIRAAARLEQLRNYLTDDATRELVAEAEAAGDTVVMVEVDPQEGSGVIPLDWVTLLQPRREDERILDPVRGTSVPRLRRIAALAGVEPRDYDYSVFWVVFPLVRPDGSPLLTDAHDEAELIVRIYEKEGRVRWPIPPSIRARTESLIEGSKGADIEARAHAVWRLAVGEPRDLLKAWLEGGGRTPTPRPAAVPFSMWRP